MDCGTSTRATVMPAIASARRTLPSLSSAIQHRNGKARLSQPLAILAGIAFLRIWITHCLFLSKRSGGFTMPPCVRRRSGWHTGRAGFAAGGADYARTRELRLPGLIALKKAVAGIEGIVLAPLVDRLKRHVLGAEEVLRADFPVEAGALHDVDH